jgi:hypothetical protein
MLVLPRSAITAVAALLCAGVISSAPPALPAFPQQPDAATSRATLAKKLVAQLVHASSEAARTQALINIMSALNLGVYKGNGEAIIRGAERGPHDFYLYDFEVSGMQAALQRKQMWSVQDLSSELTAMGFHPPSKALDPQALNEGLASAVRWGMEHAGDPHSTSLLIIRDLGETHQYPYDLTKTPSLSAVNLDALQFFLIAANLLIPLAPPDKQTDVPQKIVAFASNRVGLQSQLLADAGPCDFGGDSRAFVQFLKVIASIIGGTVGNGAKFIIPVEDALHALLVGLNITAEYTGEQPAQTHWGPDVSGHFSSLHRPGTPIRLSILVFNHMPWQPEDIACGALLGYKLPKFGGMPDVPVNWSFTFGPEEDNGLPVPSEEKGYEDLLTQGTVTRADPKTDRNGFAELDFTPKDEAIPEFGKLTTTDGTLQPAVFILSNLGNIMAWPTQLLMPRTVTISWRVERHKPSGFRFQAKFFATYSGKSGETGGWLNDLVGEVCGDDPYAKPWTITDNENLQAPMVSHADIWSTQVQFSSGAIANWTGRPTEGNAEVSETATLQLQIPPPPGSPKMLITFNYVQATGIAHLDTPTPETQTADVTDASDCSSD